MDGRNFEFTTYLNYLRAIQGVINQYHPNLHYLVRSIEAKRGYQKMQGGRNVDINRIEEELGISWYTELLMMASGEYPKLAVYASPWSMIQAYYSIYFSIRAYLTALDTKVSENHRATLRTIASKIKSHQNIFVEPWNFLYAGDPHSDKVVSYLYSNINVALPKSGLYMPSSIGEIQPINTYSLFMKTTRRRRLAEKILQWKKDNSRKNIKGSEKLEILKKLRPTSFFDLMFRLRIKSNYESMGMFTFSDITDSDAYEFHKTLCFIVSETNLCFEVMTKRLIGTDKYSALVQKFHNSEKLGYSQFTFIRRWEAMMQKLNL